MVLIVIIGLSLVCKMRMLYLGRMQKKTYLAMGQYVAVTFILIKQTSAMLLSLLAHLGRKLIGELIVHV